MSSIKFFRPQTGADSVPFPAECHQDLNGPDTPQGSAAWKRYWADREEAARRETADEAIVRCRDEAAMLDGAERFDHVLDTIVDVFDRQVQDLSGPDADQWRGMGLMECSFYHDASCWARVWQEMEEAFSALDRDRFRKAAAEYAGTLADLSVGMRVVETSKQEGQA
jgi:hypothetical protein